MLSSEVCQLFFSMARFLYIGKVTKLASIRIWKQKDFQFG